MGRGRYKHVWNAERNEFIRRNAGKMKDSDLAAEMTRLFGYKFSIVAIRLQRRSLGIKKENGRGKCAIQNTIQNSVQDKSAKT